MPPQVGQPFSREEPKHKVSPPHKPIGPDYGLAIAPLNVVGSQQDRTQPSSLQSPRKKNHYLAIIAVSGRMNQPYGRSGRSNGRYGIHQCLGRVRNRDCPDHVFRCQRSQTRCLVVTARYIRVSLGHPPPLRRRMKVESHDPNVGSRVTMTINPSGKSLPDRVGYTEIPPEIRPPEERVFQRDRLLCQGFGHLLQLAPR